MPVGIPKEYAHLTQDCKIVLGALHDLQFFRFLPKLSQEFLTSKNAVQEFFLRFQECVNETQESVNAKSRTCECEVKNV